jgi:hypothetical protein
MHALASLYPFHLIQWEFLKGRAWTKPPARHRFLPALALRRVPHRRARPPVSTDPRGAARASFAWHVRRSSCRAGGASGEVSSQDACPTEILATTAGDHQSGVPRR